MVDFVSVLEKNPNGVLATQDGVKIKTRIFRYLFTEGKKVYFCTNSQKPVYAQILTNPNVSFCTHNKDYFPVMSVSGRAFVAEDLTLKDRTLKENPPIKEIYKSVDNPIFKIFYIDVDEIKTFSYDDGPGVYTF
jgi:uncharacterized pyridoxamine 5'-phosphate oxidase family protein